MPEIAAQLQRHGYCLVPNVVDGTRIAALKVVLAEGELARAERDGQTYGARNLLHIAPVRDVVAAPKIISCLLPLLGPGFRAVRGLFFDKTAKANWPVLWHQDLTLALRERRDLQGWTNWTVKRGVTHAQPPPEILNRMVTMRLHLDDCPVENGALRIVSGSHGEGLLSRDTIQDAAKAAESIAAKAGEALFMRPLLLHASSPAQTPSHRRVLHLEFAPANLLPPELAWAEA